MKRQRIIFALLALPAFAAGAAVSRADSPGGYFRYGYYMPVSGRVGRPLTADAAFSVDDMPPNCVPDWKDMVISGALPPGMDVANSNSSQIAGTPVTAGTWPVTVTFHALGCSYNRNDRVDRTIKVVFHIAP